MYQNTNKYSYIYNILVLFVEPLLVNVQVCVIAFIHACTFLTCIGIIGMHGRTMCMCVRLHNSDACIIISLISVWTFLHICIV